VHSGATYHISSKL